MRHYFDTVFNTSGGPVEGVKVRLTDAAGNAVPIFSDDSGTPLAGDTAISNARGLFEFYVPFATYNLNYYSPSETLIQVIPNVYMGSDATDALIDALGDAVDAMNVAQASAVQTGLDVEATHADVVLTHADVLLTHGDVAATGADRVQTAIDAAAAAASADRIDLGAFDADVLQVHDDRVQTGLDRTATGIDVQTSAANGLIATNNATMAVAASAAVGVFANAAAANIPRGVVSFATTGGSGGTNGLNLAATFTGGTLTYNPQIFYDVVGGVVTNVRMTFSGLYIGAGTPTMPAVVLANGAGGAAVTLAGGRLFVAGQGWWVVSADNRRLERYINVSNAASLDMSVPPIYLQPALDDVFNAGGAKNLWPDPFFTESSIPTGLRNSIADSPYLISGADWLGFFDPTAASPYPAGKVLVRKGNVNIQTPVIDIFLDRFGLTTGDSFQIATEAALLAGGSVTTGNFIQAQFRDRGGANIGSSVVVMAPTTANPLNTVYRSFISGNLTVPAGAWRLTLSFTQWGGLPDYGFCSFQVVKGTALAKPVQRMTLADAANRIKAIEDHDPASAANNVLLRRTTYASATIAPLVGTATGTLNTFAAFGGYGSSYLAAACPVGGFNLVSAAWNWTPSATNGPVKLIAVVRTCVTGSNPLNTGKTIAWGWIDTDPATGTAGNEPIQLFDPITGLPKTVTPADLLDLMGIGVAGVTVSGGPPTQMNVTYAVFSNADPAQISYQIAGLPAGFSTAWGTVGSLNSWYPTLMLAVSPVTKTNVPSPSFAGRIAQLSEEPPSLIACPQKMWAIVGHPCWVHFDPLLQRDPKRTVFSATFNNTLPGTFPTNPSGCYNEGFLLQPAAAGTTTMALKASNQDLIYDTKTVTFVTCTASAGGAGTKRFLMLGDSMTASAGMQATLLTLAATDGVFSIVNMGTMGANPNKNEGYSGQPLGIFFSAGNPFYNPSTLTFDFSYYLSSTGQGAPTHVMIAGGFWNVANAANDSTALTSSQFACGTVTTMIASIHAYDPTIKVAVWGQPSQPRDGQEGQARPVGPAAQGQMQRNLRILAGQVISTFSGLETSNTFVVCTNAAMNPETGYVRLPYAPRNDAIDSQIVSTPYVNYAAMAADLTPASGTMVKVTNGSGFFYFIKEGATGGGHWRNVDERDGFVRRWSDTIHPAAGFRQMGEQTFAWIKNNP